MGADEDGGPSRKRQRIDRLETGPYILRPLLDNVQLSVQGESDEVPQISCVELWGENLYIGTTTAKILHYVAIPSQAGERDVTPTFILASRLEPLSGQLLPSPHRTAGVEQIVVLPRSNKACVLCNGTLTFYSLPELTPAFGTTKVKNCFWIGGIDLSQSDRDNTEVDDLIMISLKDRVQLVKIQDVEKPRVIKSIEYPGTMLFARRDSIACVATAHSYALLDIDHLRKIPLFPISSLDETLPGDVGGQTEQLSSKADTNLSRSDSSKQDPSGRRGGEDKGHGRSTSLGALVGGLAIRQQPVGPGPRDLLDAGSPERSVSPARRGIFERPKSMVSQHSSRMSSPEKPLPATPLETPEPRSGRSGRLPTSSNGPLKPMMLSPNSSEFLLTTGTEASEAGVGIFVDLDGEVTRSTLEFERYPESIVSDGTGVKDGYQDQSMQSSEGYILAVIQRGVGHTMQKGLEIQRWDIDPGEAASSKEWIHISSLPDIAEVQDDSIKPTSLPRVGIRQVITPAEITIDQVCARLCLTRLRMSRSSTSALLDVVASDSNKNDLRTTEEEQFAGRLGRVNGHMVVWADDQIWWIVRTPLAVQLDAAIDLASPRISDASQTLDRRKLITILNGIRGREPTTETEFVSLQYIRQKASVLLFIDMLISGLSGHSPPYLELQAAEEALSEGGVDPRVILSVTPVLSAAVKEGQRGIWIHRGVEQIMMSALLSRHTPNESDDIFRESFPRPVLDLLKGFLLDWRRKKGFGSIADEEEVFQSVDIALLHLLLELDRQSPTGRATSGSVRAELYALVDNKLGCFADAVALLEKYQRLYVLSRLYQSQKEFSNVLSTWRRILEGDPDTGGEFRDGEMEMRKYLSRIRDPTLVEEYGTWLARRNPKIGVHVFADDSSRVRFEPDEVIRILKTKAPQAVKEYLEYLVFVKGVSTHMYYDRGESTDSVQNTQHINNLIFYYLETVLSVIAGSPAARSALEQSYVTYRALSPPRPTYGQFITDNALDEEWWHNRLRLLQLLGGSQTASSDYDVPAILGRIEPYERELVPEMIILDGRQARHQQALRLLTHGLGDFDTAINYCLLGGSSIYRPRGGKIPPDEIPSRNEQAVLFGHLLSEFLVIQDMSERVEQTSNLLERFGAWYDVRHVLQQIPDSWSVELISGFLVGAIRLIVTERNETMVAKSLSGAENLKISADCIEKFERSGPAIGTDESVRV